MTGTKRALIAVGVAATVALAPAAPALGKPSARAADRPSARAGEKSGSRSVEGGEAQLVTLRAGRNRMPYGQSTGLRGRITPHADGETVEIVDLATGRVVASDTTDPDGRFKLRYSPKKDIRLIARWVAAVSDPIRLRVKPIVRLHLSDVRLFGKARIRGGVTPRMRGRSITIKLARAGVVVGSRRVKLRKGRWISTRMWIRKPGRHRARAVLKTPDFLTGYARSANRWPPLPRLSVGSHSPYVNLLEKRLIDLGYYLPGHNWAYNTPTADAVRAFNKVQGRTRVGSVDTATWQRLATPIRPRARYRRPGDHIEINQTRQVIYIVRSGKVRRILHTSTGANGATRDGSFRVHRKLAGYSANRLYYPSYFDGLRAFHGWPEVPIYPASHGCARVPMWSATWIYSKAPIGTRVYVYH